MSEIGNRYVVHGRVQGVGFRFFTQRQARKLGVRGWVRNLADGTVEVRVRGEREDVESLRKALAQGPPHSAVSRVDEMPLGEADDWRRFEIEP